MLTDEEKLQTAKERYKRFMDKFTGVEDRTPDQQYRAYVFHNNGTVTEDFYWYDHQITPTALYRWIRNYNTARKARAMWINKIVIEDEMYNYLSAMVDQKENIIIRDVLVIPKSKNVRA